MNLGELIDWVQKIVDDNSMATAEKITDILNYGMLDVAAAVNLVGLDTAASIMTVPGDYRVALPDDFMRELHFVKDLSVPDGTNTRNRIQIVAGLAELQRRYDDLDWPGPVLSVAEEGGVLFYTRVPDVATALEVRYYRNPTPMSALTDTPDGLHPEFHHFMLVHYAAAELFSYIEDGVEGEGSNQQKHQQAYMDALGVLASKAYRTSHTRFDWRRSVRFF